MGFIIYNIVIGLVIIFFVYLYSDFMLERLKDYDDNVEESFSDKVISIIMMFCPIINIFYLGLVLFVIYSDDETFENFKKFLK